MADDRRVEQLLECLLQVIGRVAVPEANVRGILGEGPKQLRAFNLADGTRTQREIARQARVDQGSLSRTFTRWVRSGIAFWIGDGKDARLVHIYPVPHKGKPAKKRPGGRRAKRR